MADPLDRNRKEEAVRRTNEEGLVDPADEEEFEELDEDESEDDDESVEDREERMRPATDTHHANSAGTWSSCTCGR